MARNTPVPMRVVSGQHEKIMADTPALGEILFDAGEHTLVAGDGATKGGHPMASRAYVDGIPRVKIVDGPLPEDVQSLIADLPIDSVVISEE